MATDVGTLQSKLTLDFSQFASGMNSAISMVRSFGKQLQKALGSNATQGFSTTNQAIHDIQTSITNLQAAVSNFQATMQNANNTLAQISNVQANTGRIGQDLGRAANNMGDVNQQSRRTADSMGDVSRQTRRTSSDLDRVSSNSRRAEQNARKLSSHLDAAQSFAHNLKRILGGIVVSQAFYRLLGIMQDLVSSSIQFMTNMEQSAIAFKYLLGNAENASGFLQALQDFAVSSPMDVKGAETAARMLMTMGFEAESTITVLRTLTDAATVAGGEMSDTVYRIALALGQMLQSGTVKMQELRQLVNANIPIFSILQEELGLTSKQIANIGKESVDSSRAVMAILSGLQKRFGGASLEMQKTTIGALSAAKDSFYVFFNEVMSGPYEIFRQKLVQLSETMQYLAQIARQSGAGGVFETIVPERLHGIIRNVIGAFMQLGRALLFLGKIAAEVFGGMGEIITGILNIILPPITILLNAIMQFTYGLLKAYPIIKYFFSALVLLAIAKTIGAIFLWFWKIIGLGKIIMTVVSYIITMAKALKFLGVVIITHPIIAVITGIIVTVLALTGVLQKAINKIKEFFSLLGAKMTNSDKTLNKSLNIGYDPNKILQPTDKETNDSAEKYKSSLEEIDTKLEDIGDEANKTKNKLKNAFNQSFDEVYTINPNTGSDLGLDGLDKLELPLGELSAFNDALADLTDFDLGGWTDNFMIAWQEMWEQIKAYLQEFGLGALLAGVLAGALTGNPWIGLATALAALFWPAISDQLGLTEDEGAEILGASLGVLLGAVIAKIAQKGILTGAMWAGIGALIFAGLWPAIQEYMDSGDWESAIKSLNFTLFGAGIGALIGNLIGGVAGAALGGVIGGFLGNGIEGGIDAWIDDGSWEQVIKSMDWISIGTAIGTLIGTLIGGPLGGVFSGLIGSILGYGLQQGIDAWANDESGWQIADAVDWTTVGTAIGTAIGTLIGGPLGAAAGLIIGGLVGSIVDNISEVLGTIDGEWDIAAEAFKMWGNDIADAFLDGLFGDGGLFGWSTQIFSWASECFEEAGEAWKEQDWSTFGRLIIEGILAGIGGAITAVFEPISRFFLAVVKAICKIFGINSPAKEMEPYGANILFGLLEGIISTISQIPDYIKEVGEALIEAMCDWFTDIGDEVNDWLSDAVTAIQDFITDTSEDIGGWCSDRITDFTDFKAQAGEKISSWANSASTSIQGWATNTASNVQGWVSSRIGDFSSFASQAGTHIGTWANTAKSKINSFTSTTSSKISSWVNKQVGNFTSFTTNTGAKISSWASTTKNNITNWATNTKSSISTWSSTTKQTISDWATKVKTSISNWWTKVKEKFKAFKQVSFTNWCNNTFTTISNWCSNVWGAIKDKIGKAVDKIKEFLNLNGKSTDFSVTANVSGKSTKGHADGGIFDREHWARFAEGNKAEAIIPLENDSAMQPFVDAVSNGLTASLAPIISTMNANNTNSNNLQPLYVGTLVADERGLKELERKMQIIRIKEGRRS